MKIYKRFDNPISKNLVGISKTPHTAHNSQYVIVSGVNAYLPSISRAYVSKIGDVGKIENELCVVDTREIARTGRLVLLGTKAEGVHVDVLVGDTGVRLVRLNQTEVGLGANLEAIVAVEQDLGVGHKIDSVRRSRRTRKGSGEVKPIIVRGTDGKILGHLQNPHKLLDGVIEIEANLVSNLVKLKRFSTSELKLIDKVFVRHLSESTSFFGVEVDVVNPQGCSLKAYTSGIDDTRSIRCVIAIAGGGEANDKLSSGTELKDDLDFVVLKSDKRKRKTGVLTEPELKRYVVDTGACGVANKADVSRVLTNHVVVTILLLGSLGKLIPDLEPHTVVLVNALTTNLNLHIADECVTKGVSPRNVVG